MDKCPYCGTMVKNVNLEGHVARVHPSRVTSSTKPPAVMKTRSFFPSHRKRKAVIAVGTVLISIVIIAVTLTGTHNMSGMGSNPGPGPAGSQAEFDYLSPISSYRAQVVKFCLRTCWARTRIRTHATHVVGASKCHRNYDNRNQHGSDRDYSLAFPMTRKERMGLHDRWRLGRGGNSTGMDPCHVSLQVHVLHHCPAVGTLIHALSPDKWSLTPSKILRN